MKAIVGIDVSKHKFYATCIKEDKEILFSPELPNQITGFNNLLSILQNLSKTFQIVIVMESTGSYYINLASFLIKNNQTFSFNKISLRKTKTDKRDSKVIALLHSLIQINFRISPQNSLNFLQEKEYL